MDHREVCYHHYWLDSRWWALAFLRSFAHLSLLRATFFQFLTSNILMSWSTPSPHCSFDLPTLLIPSSLVLNIFFYSSVIIHTHQVPCPCQSFNFDVIDNVWFIKCFIWFIIVSFSSCFIEKCIMIMWNIFNCFVVSVRLNLVLTLRND